MPQTAKERQALDRLFSLTYEELRRLASSVKRGDPSSTLSATALVNEAWLKLAKQLRYRQPPRVCTSSASPPALCARC